MTKIDLDNFGVSLIKVKEMMDDRKSKLLDIVNPFLTPDLERKRQIELAHIAKFILAFDTNIILEKMMESPDFVISQNGKKIGIEIRQFYTKKIESIGYIQQLFDKTSEKFAKQYTDVKILVNFWLQPNFNYKKNDSAVLVDEIVEYVYNEIKHTAVAKPSYIEKIDIQHHSNLSFHYNEGAYSQQALEEEIVLNAIKEKELKIEKYIENSETEFQWLLLVNGEVGSDSFDTYDFQKIENIESDFEHIFLLKDFDIEIIKIK